jgi:hypothetical protein
VLVLRVATRTVAIIRKARLAVVGGGGICCNREARERAGADVDRAADATGVYVCERVEHRPQLDGDVVIE